MWLTMQPQGQVNLPNNYFPSSVRGADIETVNLMFLKRSFETFSQMNSG